MKIIIYGEAREAEIAFKQERAKTSDFSFVRSKYEDLKDLDEKFAIVCAGNSFGIMDGGIDLDMANHHNPNNETPPPLQQKIQKEIIEQHGGELLVGNVVTAKHDGRWFIYAPTMQVPQNIMNTANVYNACRTATRTALKIKGVRALVVPMMGCGSGGLPYDFAMRQIIYGIHDGMTPFEGESITWEDALYMHKTWHELTGLFDTEESAHNEIMELVEGEPGEVNG